MGRNGTGWIPASGHHTRDAVGLHARLYLQVVHAFNRIQQDEILPKDAVDEADQAASTLRHALAGGVVRLPPSHQQPADFTALLTEPVRHRVTLEAAHWHGIPAPRNGISASR